MNPIPTPRCCARAAKAFNGRNAAEVAKRFHLTECMVITIAQYHAALQEALRQLDAKDAEIAALYAWGATGVAPGPTGGIAPFPGTPAEVNWNSNNLSANHKLD